MKNKKIMLVFITIIIMVMALTPLVKASDSTNPLNVIEAEDQNNTINNEVSNTNNETSNNTLIVNNEPNTENTNTNVNENKLPQLGVAEDATLFVFIAVCLVSAVYAYTKIKNYKNV